MISQATLKRLFIYTENGDLLSRKIRCGRKKCITINSLYRYLYVYKKQYLLHRMIFLWHHGYLPKEIDHIDRNKKNNRIDNLRACDRSLNMVNRSTRAWTGFRGVSFDKTRNKFTAQITFNKVHINLGRYKSAKDAAMAYDKKAKLFHGEVAMLNFPAK